MADDDFANWNDDGDQQYNDNDDTYDDGDGSYDDDTYDDGDGDAADDGDAQYGDDGEEYDEEQGDDGEYSAVYAGEVGDDDGAYNDNDVGDDDGGVDDDAFDGVGDDQGEYDDDEQGEEEYDNHDVSLQSAVASSFQSASPSVDDELTKARAAALSARRLRASGSASGSAFSSSVFGSAPAAAIPAFGSNSAFTSPGVSSSIGGQSAFSAFGSANSNQASLSSFGARSNSQPKNSFSPAASVSMFSSGTATGTRASVYESPSVSPSADMSDAPAADDAADDAGGGRKNARQRRKERQQQLQQQRGKLPAVSESTEDESQSAAGASNALSMRSRRFAVANNSMITPSPSPPTVLGSPPPAPTSDPATLAALINDAPVSHSSSRPVRDTASLMAAAMGTSNLDDVGGDDNELFRADNFKPIVGECMTMCPLEEISARQEARDLSFFEIVPGTGSKAHGDVPHADVNKCVKKYKRAAAAQTLHAKDVRPRHVLQQVMRYLVDDVVDRTDFPDQPPFLGVERFVSDRFRAVRQDYVCQMIRDGQTITSLEQQVRFHITVMYLLGDVHQIDKFNPTPNVEKLSQTLTSLRHIYADNYKRLVEQRRSGGDVSIGTLRANAALPNAMPFDAPNEAEMHSYRLLMDLGRLPTLYAELEGRCSPDISRSPIIQFCLQIYLAYQNLHYARFMKLLQRAPYCHAVLLQPSVNLLRARSLEVMSRAYRSYPLMDYVQLFGFDDTPQAIEFLDYHGIRVMNSYSAEAEIAFHAGGYIHPASTHPVLNLHRVIGPKQHPKVSATIKHAIGRGDGLRLLDDADGGAPAIMPVLSRGDSGMKPVLRASASVFAPVSAPSRTHTIIQQPSTVIAPAASSTSVLAPPAPLGPMQSFAPMTSASSLSLPPAPPALLSQPMSIQHDTPAPPTRSIATTFLPPSSASTFALNANAATFVPKAAAPSTPVIAPMTTLPSTTAASISASFGTTSQLSSAAFTARPVEVPPMLAIPPQSVASGTPLQRTPRDLPPIAPVVASGTTTFNAAAAPVAPSPVTAAVPHPRPPLPRAPTTVLSSVAPPPVVSAPVSVSASTLGVSALAPVRAPAVVLPPPKPVVPQPPPSPPPHVTRQRTDVARAYYKSILMRACLSEWCRAYAHVSELRCRADLFLQTKWFLAWHAALQRRYQQRIKFDANERALHADDSMVLRTSDISSPSTAMVPITPAHNAFSTALVPLSTPSTSLIMTPLMQSHLISPTVAGTDGMMSPRSKLMRLGVDIGAWSPPYGDDHDDDEQGNATTEDDADDEYHDDEMEVDDEHANADGAYGDGDGDDDGVQPMVLDYGSDDEAAHDADGTHDDAYDDDGDDGEQQHDGDGADPYHNDGDDVDADRAGEVSVDASASAPATSAFDRHLVLYAVRSAFQSPLVVASSSQSAFAPLSTPAVGATAVPSSAFQSGASKPAVSAFASSPQTQRVGHKRSRESADESAFMSPHHGVLSPNSNSASPSKPTSATSALVRQQMNSSGVNPLVDESAAASLWAPMAERASTRAKLFHTPSHLGPRAVFSPPYYSGSAHAVVPLSLVPATAASPIIGNRSHDVAAALLYASTPSALVSPRRVSPLDSSSSRFHRSSLSPHKSAFAVSDVNVNSHSSEQLAHDVHVEMAHSQRLQHLMAMLEQRVHSSAV